MMKDSILEVRNVKKRFGNVEVLRGISAEVAQGSITGFVGPNGAGKTTLFHTITGDLTLDEGSVLYNGKSIGGMRPWRIARLGLGKLFQVVRIFDSLTVVENVLLAMDEHTNQSALVSLLHAPNHWLTNGKRYANAENWLDGAGVERPFDRPAGALSFGNKKLLAMARLMAGGFHFLLLDEPASGLAPNMIRRVGDLLRMLVEEQKVTIALIEHNFSFVAEVADYVYILQDGAVFDHGPAGEVLNRDENSEILIGL